MSKVKIISNNNIKRSYFELVLSAAEIAGKALPGQFVNIKVSEGIEPLLRRPISIHRIRVSKCQGVKVSEVVLLYEVLGKGTEMLSEKKAGEYLDVIGPLGAGFRITNHDSRFTILVAGGMGTAPLVFLAERLSKRWTKPACSPLGEAEGRQGRDEGRRTTVLIGAKTKDSILCEKEFKELGCEVKIATDDGSRGFKGYVSDLLKDILRPSSSILRPSLYACGPKLLLKEISRISQEYNISAQLSLESHMACGIGACMGCVIKTKDEACLAGRQGRRTKDAFQYKRVCKEGPVFEANQILWE